MRIVFTIFVFFAFIEAHAQTNLDEIRLNYIKALSDKNLCGKMLEELDSKKQQPIYLSYLGGFQAIWAKHLINPISKLKTFNKGKENIESAIQKDSDNPELRYIRLSVQKNAPFFLGYNDMVKTDTEFLKCHKNEISSVFVLENIELLLKNK